MPGGNVLDFNPTPNGSFAIYTGDLTTDGVFELYSASTVASGSQITLNDTPVTGGDVFQGVPTPDSTRVVYLGDLTVNGRIDIYSASVSAPNTQIRISTNLVISNILVSSLSITPDSSRAIYLSDMTTSGVNEIYSASTSAANTQITLNDAPVSGGNVIGVAMTPDGSRVVYTGDLSTDEIFELYSASTLTTNSQIKISTLPVGGGDVSSFQISPDGTRAVYIGDLDTDGIDELYSASITSSGTQVKITSFPISSEILSFQFTPDSKSVVFSITDLVDGESLWIVNALGTSAPVRLTSPVAHSVTIDRFKITDDSTKVLFTADLGSPGINALYSASLSSAAPLTADPTLKITGGKTIKTSSGRVTVKGTANSAAGILKVEFKVPGSKFKRAKGTTRWKAIIRPTKKSTPVKIRAVDANGRLSRLSKVTIKLI